MIIDWICGKNIKSPRCLNTGGLDRQSSYIFYFIKISSNRPKKFIKMLITPIIVFISIFSLVRFPLFINSSLLFPFFEIVH